MASYSIRIKKSALRELEAIPTKAERRRVVRRIELLADNPRPSGVQKLSGYDFYRVRQGHYRILYVIRDSELIVQVIRIGDRKSVYRRI